jgi:hypothetical protein
MYPKNYFFALTKDGIDGRQSLLLDGGQHRRSSTATNVSIPKTSQRRQSLRQGDATKPPGDDQQDSAPASPQKPLDQAIPAEVPDVEMDGLAGAMSALQFVPPSIKFGRGRGKTGFAKS